MRFPSVQLAKVKIGTSTVQIMQDVDLDGRADVLKCRRLHLHGFIFRSSISFEACNGWRGRLIGPLSIRYPTSSPSEDATSNFFSLWHIAIAVRAELVHPETW
jgi:hypothetical protein